MTEKPKMNLIGEDGNIYAIMGRASILLRQNGMEKESKEMFDRVTSCHSYEEALGIVSEYVETELSPIQNKTHNKEKIRHHER